MESYDRVIRDTMRTSFELVEAVETAYADARIDSGRPPLRECQDKFASHWSRFGTML